MEILSYSLIGFVIACAGTYIIYILHKLQDNPETYDTAVVPLFKCNKGDVYIVICYREGRTYGVINYELVRNILDEYENDSSIIKLISRCEMYGFKAALTRIT